MCIDENFMKGFGDYKNFHNAKFRYDIVTATSNVESFGMYLKAIYSIAMSL